MKAQILGTERLHVIAKMDWRLVILSIGVFLLTFLAPVSYSGADPKFTLLVSQSIIEYGTVRLDNYQDDMLLGSPFQRHISSGVIREYNGHYYNYFPVGPSIFTLPVVGATSALGYDMRQTSDNFLVQRILASLTSAAMVWIVYQIARAYLPETPSLVIAAVSVLGSAFVSTMGTALWSINFSAVLMGLSLLLIVRYDTGDSQSLRPVLLGVLLFLSFFSRASSAAFIVAVFVYLLIKDRKQFLKTAAVALCLFLLFMFWSRLEFGSWLPAYYSTSRLGLDRDPIWIAIYAHLFSASRGIFVFSPFLLLVIPGFVLFWRRFIRRPIVLLCLIWIPLLLYISSRAVEWWGGYSFGPRLVTELILAFSLLIVLMWRDVIDTLHPKVQRVLAALFLLLGAIAIFINGFQGLYNANTSGWNVYVEPQAKPPMTGLGDLFDWSHPQFLATGEGICSFRSDRMLLLLEHDNTLTDYRIGDMIWHNADSVMDFEKAAFLAADSQGSTTISASNNGAEDPNTLGLGPRVFLPMIEMYANDAVFIGWSDAQEHLSYRWSDCKRVQIVFRLGEEIQERSTYTMALTAGSNGVQQTEVSLNGARIGDWTFASPVSDPESAVFHFDGELLLPNDNNTITLEIPDASRTKAGEWRLFGLALFHLSIYPGDIPPPLPPSTPPTTSYP